MNNNISLVSRVLVGVCAIFLTISIFVPIWRIELDAPQYPEGLAMTIHANKLGGDVEIINGLNHYIGMGTLHKENFIEFTVLPYIIGFFALLFLIVALVGKKRILLVSFISFALFGIVAMIDFYKWEYEYGHNLDPTAAIIVPGMAYQPPLIGFKQLLNFGAYSIPDIGGWLFILVGIILLSLVTIENKWILKCRDRKITIVTGLVFFLFASCSSNKADPIKLNRDKCDYCQMTIADGRFGAELITTKGRVYKFDDFHCMHDYALENYTIGFKAYYVNDYNAKNELIDATKSFYVQHQDIRSPMGSNVAGFKTMEEANEIAQKFNTQSVNWEKINK